MTGAAAGGAPDVAAVAAGGGGGPAPASTSTGPRRLVVWVLVLVVLASGALVGAAATERYQKSQVRHLVSARAQVARFGDHDTYLLIWNDQIFATLVPIPEGWVASLPEGARLRVFYSPQTQQVVLRSRRYDAPQLLLVLGASLLAAAAALPARVWWRRRRSHIAPAVLADSAPLTTPT